MYALNTIDQDATTLGENACVKSQSSPLDCKSATCPVQSSPLNVQNAISPAPASPS